MIRQNQFQITSPEGIVSRVERMESMRAWGHLGDVLGVFSRWRGAILPDAIAEYFGSGIGGVLTTAG